jgi:hypothetical protein
MTSLFSTPKSVKAPPIPAPQAIPQENPESSDAAYRKMYSKNSYMRQKITGPLTPMSTGRKPLLG